MQAEKELTLKSVTNSVHEVEPLSELEYQSGPATSVGLPERPEANTLELLETLYAKRQLLFKMASWALILSSVLVFLIPKRYESTVSIMPPESASEAGSMI